MPFKLRRSRLILSVVVLLGSAFVITGSPIVSAKSRVVDRSQSSVVLDNNGSGAGSSHSPCSKSKGCANGVRFLWAKGACDNSYRYSPIVIVWTVNHKVAKKTWPLIAPCSTGLQISWDKKNHLTEGSWRGSSAPTAGMAVCFQHAGQCSKSDCVTEGCLPKNVNGADIFFSAGDSLTRAAWLRNGHKVGSISTSGSADDVFWYGKTPPASPFAISSTGIRQLAAGQPKVTLLGRTKSNSPETTSAVAPSGADGVNFKWFLSAAGGVKQCTVVGSTAWTSPPVTFVYTHHGQLDSRVSILTCPNDSSGQPARFNGADFSWISSGGTKQLNSAVQTFDGVPMTGLPASSMPQPPSGTDGLVFGFQRDDYQSATWTQGGALSSTSVPAPGHTRLATWKG